MNATWDEIRTAYHVARLGTVSAAAEVLGVHHATVIRHVGALEKRLGVKLFQRHGRGYTPTEAGAELLRVARVADEQFAQMAARLSGGDEAAGELVVTSLASVSPLLTPLLARFRIGHPHLALRYLSDERLFRMEYGEAHVAVRAGPPPEEPDNVVQPFAAVEIALFASRGYLDRCGVPEGEEGLAPHAFVGLAQEESRVPWERWLRRSVAPERVVFRATDERVAGDAVAAGIGLGFLPVWEAARQPDLVEVLPSRPEWGARLWLVTHVDLHRGAKVQALLAFLKAAPVGPDGYLRP